MIKNLALLVLIGISLTFSSQAYAGQVNLKKLNKRKWVSVNTEYFNVVTDAGEKRGQEMAEELERFRFFLTEMLGFKPKNTSNKVPVLLAKSSGTYKRFGIHDNISGVFSRRGNTVSIVANGQQFSSSKKGGQNQGRQTILHELVHLITHGADLEMAMPPWFSEGIAEYFGTYTEKKGQIIIGQVSLVGFRFYSTRHPNGTWQSMDVESLLKATSTGLDQSRSRKNAKQVDRFYARSFALVHYLNADHTRKRNMYVYLHLLKKGYSVDQSFAAAFETTYEKMTEEVDNYIQGKYVSARAFQIGEGGVSFPEVKMETATLSKEEAMQFIISKLAILGPPIIAEKDKYDMLDELSELYPGKSFTY